MQSRHPLKVNALAGLLLLLGAPLASAGALHPPDTTAAEVETEPGTGSLEASWDGSLELVGVDAAVSAGAPEISPSSTSSEVSLEPRLA